jgi:hypothetical protein
VASELLWPRNAESTGSRADTSTSAQYQSIRTLTANVSQVVDAGTAVAGRGVDVGGGQEPSEDLMHAAMLGSPAGAGQEEPR